MERRVEQFAHPVEKALAEVLDELEIAWLYEPHTFPLEHAADGSVAAAFTPDFYLPELGMYVECTVARRKWLSGKRKKVRAATRLHGIVCEIAYRDDFERIARRWSLGSLAKALGDVDGVSRQPPVVAVTSE
jgi:hypothetical protein